MSKTRKQLLGVTLIALLAMTTASFAATNSNAPTVALNATVNPSLTISLSGATETWASITPGNATNAGGSTITVTMNWVLSPAHSQVALYAFFASSTQALTDATCASSCTDIPSSAFEIAATSGTGTIVAGSGVNAPLSQTNAGFGAASASRQIKTVTISGANKIVNGDATVLSFNLNLTSLASMAAGTYTGTLTIQAQATP